MSYSKDFRSYTIGRHIDHLDMIEKRRRRGKKRLEKKVKTTFCRMTGFIPDKQNGEKLYVGDVVLFYENKGFRVIENCPKCYEETESEICHSIEEIGKQLSKFRPDLHAHPRECCLAQQRENRVKEKANVD